MELDVFVVGESDGWVLAPAGSRLPMAEVGALGRLRLVGRFAAADALTDAQRSLVIRDIDARGYGIVAADDLPAVANAAWDPPEGPLAAPIAA